MPWQPVQTALQTTAQVALVYLKVRAAHTQSYLAALSVFNHKHFNPCYDIPRKM